MGPYVRYDLFHIHESQSAACFRIELGMRGSDQRKSPNFTGGIISYRISGLELSKLKLATTL